MWRGSTLDARRGMGHGGCTGWVHEEGDVEEWPFFVVGVE
jgi:hypothetical protein